MSNYIVTVIKSGNSYALRVPKQYIEDGNLNLGDKANIPLATKAKVQNNEEIGKLWDNLISLKPFSDIIDVSAWHRQIREDRQQPGRK